MKYDLIGLDGFKKVLFLSILPILSIGIASNSIETEAQTTSLPNNNPNNSFIKNDKTYLEIQDLTVERSVTNLVEVKGKINNNSTSDLRDIEIVAKFFNKDGSPLAKTEKFITSPSYIMKPDDQLSFNILEVITFQKLGDYEILAMGKSVS